MTKYMIDSGGPSHELLLSGYDRTSHIVEAGSVWSMDQERFNLFSEQINPRGRAAFAFGAGTAYGFMGAPIEAKLLSCANLDEYDRAACAVGAGYATRKYGWPFKLCATGSKVNDLLSLGSDLLDAEEGYVSQETLFQQMSAVTHDMDPRIASGIEHFIRSRLDRRQRWPFQ